ncbi:TetR family transcriptional regulator [Actinoplanes couchii]|uniref:TetR family transcriptional regulator n=1 Tax=Actinoplanes couchii TaxID=403638 RepID=A0ABQ3XL85_9ACTN|nr:TetR family transcriptional regulator [Actinoplanes couchii]MDR6318394.1 AcrR family transcriptional regulator [Actinoplanes couchii]GID59240.1 TetR family transcriptional regulator [Actinoplanes couchii]
MARATKEQSEITGRRILEVASALFADRGYAAVGLTEVATLAEVTRGAIYHHYASKQGLFQAVTAAAQQRVADEVERAADSCPDDWQGLLAGCRAFLSAAVADRNRRILLIDAPAVLDWTTWRAQDGAASGRHLVEALTTLSADGVLRVRSIESTAALLSGAMNEAALHIATAPDPGVTLDEVVDDLSRMLGALRSSPVEDEVSGSVQDLGSGAVSVVGGQEVVADQ